MLKHEALSLFDNSPETLRIALGLKSRHAIYMWPKDQPIPAVHELKIRYQLRPDAFTSTGKLRARRAA